MPTQSTEALPTPAPAAHPVDTAVDSEVVDFDLDVRFIETGDSVEDLIYMTNDGCGSTCQSACSTTCSK